MLSQNANRSLFPHIAAYQALGCRTLTLTSCTPHHFCKTWRPSCCPGFPSSAPALWPDLLPSQWKMKNDRRTLRTAGLSTLFANLRWDYFKSRRRKEDSWDVGGTLCQGGEDRESTVSKPVAARGGTKKRHLLPQVKHTDTSPAASSRKKGILLPSHSIPSKASGKMRNFYSLTTYYLPDAVARDSLHSFKLCEAPCHRLCCGHFKDEETEAQEGKTLAKVTKLESSRAAI